MRQSITEERTAFQRSIGQPRRDRGGAEIVRVGRGGTNVVAGTRCACRPYCLSAWPLAFPDFDSTPSHCRMSQGESHWNSFSGSLYYNPSGAYHRELHFWLFLRLDIWKLETLPKQLVIDQLCNRRPAKHLITNWSITSVVSACQNWERQNLAEN